MKVRDFMRPFAATVRPDDRLSDALEIMLWLGARHLPVLEGGKLVGILSERDILRARAEHAGASATVRDAMSQPAQYISPDEPIAAAAGRMADERIGCLPVLQRDTPLGIITASDVLRAFEKEQLASVSPPLEPTAGDLMSTPVVTIFADDTLADAAARMARYNIRHLPVVDGEGRLVGIVADRDLRLPPALLRAPESSLARDFLERANVRSVMATDVVDVALGAPLTELISAFTDWRLGALPVVDEARHLLGIISYVDVLRGRRAPPIVSERPDEEPRGELLS